MKNIYSSVLIFLCGAALASAQKAPASQKAQPVARAPEAIILRVATTTEVAVVTAGGTGSLLGRQMPKFMDDIEQVQERVSVNWDAPRGGWSGPTEVRLDFRVVDEEQPRVLSQRYEETRVGRHTSVFAIPSGLTPTAIRVRLFQEGRAVDERASGSWK